MTGAWRIVAWTVAVTWAFGGACPAAEPAAGTNPDEKYVGELLDILEHTRSPDSFQVTLTLLIEAKADARRTVPVAIRNAERLGIFARHLLSPAEAAGPKRYQSSAVAELIHELAGARGGSAHQFRIEKHPRSDSSEGNRRPIFTIEQEEDEDEPAGRFPGGPRPPSTEALATPVPVAPWVTERMEEKYSTPNDFKTPILPPIREGFPAPPCEDPPSDDEVLQHMPPVRRGVPYLCEQSRDDVQIINERLVDRIDPPRFFPLIGLAQLHHCHWKSTVYYTETTESRYPFPFRLRTPRVEVVYIDRDHLHRYDGPVPSQSVKEESKCGTPSK
jgi:hypothetical protein